MTNGYDVPTVAFNLQTLLKQSGNILISEYIKTHNETKQKDVKNYLKLLMQEVSNSINRTVAESQERIRRRQKTLMPSMEDIKKLHYFLTEQRNIRFSKLNERFSLSHWTDLAEITLCSVQLFNRRRAGEVERICIEDYKNYETIDQTSDKDLFNSLPPQTKEVAKKYVRFTIRGKLNRTVPVLLDNKLVQCIELIIKYRNKAKVPKNNPYVFGLPSVGNKMKYLRACTLLRKFADQCGAEHPDRLRGTKLRKHIATTCINLNLHEQDISDLANFMGHAEKIHKQIYRQSMNTDILKMSKLLEIAQGNDSSDEETDEKEVNQQTPPVRQRLTSPYGNVRRKRWDSEEKKVIMKAFGNFIAENKLPSLASIQNVLARNPVLQNRTSPQVKSWLSNLLQKKRKLTF